MPPTMPPPGRIRIGAGGSLPSMSCQQRMSSLPRIEACKHFPTMKMHFFCAQKSVCGKCFQQLLHGKYLSFAEVLREFKMYDIPLEKLNN